MAKTHGLITATAVLMLAACSGESEVDETSSVETAATDSGGDAIVASPTPDPADSAKDTSTPANHRWFYKAETRTAIFGPPESEGVLAIACDTPDAGEPVIRVTRYTAASEGAQGVIRFQGDGSAASVPASAVRNQLGPSFIWRGSVPAPADDLRGVFASQDAMIAVSQETGAALQVPSSQAVRRVLGGCG